MDMSKVLSGRKIQPGTEKFGKPAHDRILEVLSRRCPEVTVVSEPRILKKLGLWALIPDLALTRDGKTILIEVKRQGSRGNAHERLYKFFTKKVMDRVIALLGSTEYPVYAMLCDSLATDPRYIREFEQFLEPERYLLWKDYDEDLLVKFLDAAFSSQGTFDLTALGR